MKTITMKKSYAESLVNTIRQVALTNLKTARPIAYKVGEVSNVLSAGENVLEDMVELCSSLCEQNYEFTTDAEIVKVVLPVEDVLRVSDLNNGALVVLNTEDPSKEILHTLNAPTEVTIYFRNACGCFSKDDNLYYLEQEGISDKGLTVVNSRHNAVDTFTVSFEEYDDNNVSAMIDIKCFNGATTEDVLDVCFQEIKEALEKMQ